MPLELFRPVLGDALAISNVQWDSFKSDPAMQCVCQFPVTASVRQWDAERIIKGWTSKERRAVRDTEEGAIVSVISYGFVPAMRGLAWKNFPGRPQEKVPSGVDPTMLNKCEEENWKQRVKAMGPYPFIWLQSLSTSPGNGSHGAASILLDAMVAEAERHNLPIFLTSSPSDHSLYLRYGFVDEAEYDIDLSPINESPRKTYIMVRPAPHPAGPVDIPTAVPLPVRIVHVGNSFEELREVVDCASAAFGPNPLTELCFNSSKPETIEDKVRDQKKRIDSGDYIYHKAIDSDDPDGPALGFSKWMVARDPQVETFPFRDCWPQGANVACCEATFGALKRYRDNYFKERNRPWVCMVTLTVLPYAQRRSVGSALLREGLRHVDELGFDCIVDASPAGLELYRKFGWEEVHQVTANLKDFGGPDIVETTVILVRKAGAKEKR